jgi:integrase
VPETRRRDRAQPGKDGLVFVNTRGKHTPHLSSFTSQTWKKARERIGRPELRRHDLRHTYVVIRIACRGSPKEIQEECGHSSYKTTMDLYRHLFESSSSGPPTPWRRCTRRGRWPSPRWSRSRTPPTQGSQAVVGRTGVAS